VQDSRIWKNSVVSQVLQAHNPLLLGDEGYPISPWLMTPFRQPSTPQQREFNKVFTKERVIIERCFGQLKRCFPILHYKVRLNLEKVASLIITCFVFHNVAKYLGDNDDFPDGDLDRDNNNPVDAEIYFDDLSAFLHAREVKKNQPTYENFI
jgi:hypothetical protein